MINIVINNKTSSTILFIMELVLLLITILIIHVATPDDILACNVKMGSMRNCIPIGHIIIYIIIIIYINVYIVSAFASLLKFSITWTGNRPPRPGMGVAKARRNHLG